jgi:hypothetical protein
MPSITLPTICWMYYYRLQINWVFKKNIFGYSLCHKTNHNYYHNHYHHKYCWNLKQCMIAWNVATTTWEEDVVPILKENETLYKFPLPRGKMSTKLHGITIQWNCNQEYCLIGYDTLLSGSSTFRINFLPLSSMYIKLKKQKSTRDPRACCFVIVAPITCFWMFID